MKPLANYRSWLDLAVFEDLDAARAVETFLTGKGLRARTYDDKLFRYFLFLRPPRVTWQVQVRRRHVGDTHKFWAADGPPALQKALRCPSCGSLSVSYPQMTRKFILPTIVLHLGIIFRMLEHECYCEHCHHIWNLPTEPARVPREVSHFPF